MCYCCSVMLLPTTTMTLVAISIYLHRASHCVLYISPNGHRIHRDFQNNAMSAPKPKHLYTKIKPSELVASRQKPSIQQNYNSRFSHVSPAASCNHEQGNVCSHADTLLMISSGCMFENDSLIGSETDSLKAVPPINPWTKCLEQQCQWPRRSCIFRALTQSIQAFAISLGLSR